MQRRPLKKPIPIWPFVGLAIACAGVLWWYWYSSRQQGNDLPELPLAESRQLDSLSLPSIPPLPSAQETDVLLRKKAEDISSHSTYRLWLREKDLIRRLASSIRSIANGQSPRLVMGFLAPSGRFQVVRERKGWIAHPASYQRYNVIADVVNSLNVDACAKMYSWVHPLLESAYKEIGEPGTSFTPTFARAIDQMLTTPKLPAEAVLLPNKNGNAYVYADPSLESLSDSQKHLLRMGPRNMRIIQNKLREIGSALNLFENSSPQESSAGPQR